MSNPKESWSKNSKENVETPIVSKMVLVPEELLNRFQEALSEMCLIVRQNRHPEDDILNNEEAAKFLKVSVKTLQKYRDEKLITFSQRERQIWYRK